MLDMYLSQAGTLAPTHILHMIFEAGIGPDRIKDQLIAEILPPSEK